ncbi:hypothetical protein [Ekhidna sp.]|uniref:hypothetical protein n=1 Tax=Ekhidna sp. TaxID=2608089 RepID=UPI003299CC29
MNVFISRPLLLVFLFLGYNTCQSQIPTYNPFFFGDKHVETKVPTVDLTAIGRYHFDQSWNAGNIHLKNGDSLIAYYMRYDLIRNQLEVILGNNIKAINGSFIESFEWFSVDRLRPEVFISKQSIQFENSGDVTGFLQLLEEGVVRLLKCKRMIAPKAATSPTLVNDTDSDIQAIEEFFLVLDGKAIEISGGKKKNLEIFNSKPLTKFVKQSNLRFNNESDLKKIVEYYNSGQMDQSQG